MERARLGMAGTFEDWPRLFYRHSISGNRFFLIVYNPFMEAHEHAFLNFF